MCLSQQQQCVWKAQGVVPGLFQCEELVFESPRRGERALPVASQPSAPPSSFSCLKSAAISHLTQDPCFQERSTLDVLESCGCNTDRERTYVIPSSSIFLPPGLVLNSTLFVFLHINKAAGTTMKNLLFSALLQHQWDGAGLGTRLGWRFTPMTTTTATLNSIFPHRLTVATDEVNPQVMDAALYVQCGRYFASSLHVSDFVLEQNLGLPQASMCPLRVLWGNQAMGLCDALPKGRPCVYLTVIRDPLSRALSDYLYFCVDGAENRHKWTKEMVEAGACRMSPVEWFQTMRTSPYFLIERLTRACDAQCGVQAAISNLKHPCVRYVLLDRFKDGLERIKRQFHPVFDQAIDEYLVRPQAKNSRATAKMRLKDSLGPVQLEKLQFLLREDQQVYEFAVEYYEKQWLAPLMSCNV